MFEDLYIHDVARKANKGLFQSIKYYMNGEDWKAKSILIDIIADFEIEDFKAAWILNDARKNLLSLGYHEKNNDYLKLSLKENILKHKDLGSFDMWVYVLNHIRVAMRQSRKIDISSISLFWTKYYQRKDHSLYSLYTALPIFEKLGYIEMFDSVNLITKIQDISEKGLSSSDESRSNWCPGTTTNPNLIDLGNLTPGKHTIRVSIPLGKPEGNSTSAWNVSGFLIGKR